MVSKIFVISFVCNLTATQMFRTCLAFMNMYTNNETLNMILFIPSLWFSPLWSVSEEERTAVETACRYGSKRSTYSPASDSDVTLDIAMEDKGPCVGQDAVLAIVLKNYSSSPRSLHLYSQVSATYHTVVDRTFLIWRKTRWALSSSLMRDDRMDNDLNTKRNYNCPPAQQHINNTKQLFIFGN